MGNKTVSICHALRSELQTPDLPFITAQVFKKSYHSHLINASYNAMSGGEMDHNTMIQERGRRGPWSTEKTNRVRCVSTEDLKAGDKAHFDLKSMQSLGRRFADTWWQMEGHNFPDQAKLKGVSWGE